MKKALIVSAIAFCVLGTTAPSVLGAYSVTYVGQNPWFASPGGTGSLSGTTIEKTFTSLGDIPFIVDGGPSTGTDILHIDERVRNSTGVAWTDFHFLMESIDASPALQVSFLNVINPTGEWISIQPTPNALTLLCNVPDGGTFSLSFDLAISSQVGAYNLFAIHEKPTVPEPTTLALLLLGAFAARRRVTSSR
jgi:hypothetical protein